MREKIVAEYLAAPGTKNAVAEEMSRTPEEAFCAIQEFQGPYPKEMHPIDAHEQLLKPLAQFILPGGTAAAAYLHLARTVCRRAERRVVSLAREANQAVSLDTVIYLNRLSDLLFVLARSVNRSAGVADTPWQKPGS